MPDPGRTSPHSPLPVDAAQLGAPASAPDLQRILVIEDDANYALLLGYQIRECQCEAVTATSGEEGLRRVDEVDPVTVLLDVMLPGKDGRAVLEELHAQRPELPVVMMTAAATVELAVECMKRGAYDFLTKPFELEDLKKVLHNAKQLHDLKLRVRALEGALAEQHAFRQIVAQSPVMQRVVDLARRAAGSDSDVLILGESGTGKEVLARAIHFNSARRKGPFVAINCGAIPEGLLESELFGHEKGAFTGAVARRSGCFEQAHGGTLFLDEIAEMRPEMQVRLLRALEQREVRRVGSDRTIKVDVRVISATNQDIQARLRDRRFRADLYYRLAILVLDLPALRDRAEDIGPLAKHFLQEAVRDGHTSAKSFSGDTLEALLRFPWPGNVRELRNAVERAVVFEESPVITLGSLPPEIAKCAPAGPPVEPRRLTETYSAADFQAALDRKARAAPDTAPVGALLPPAAANPPLPAASPGAMAGTPTGSVTVAERGTPTSAGPSPLPSPTLADGEILTMDQEEKRVILRALSITGGNISEAARRLGLHRSTLHRKMARYGLATDDGTAGEEGD